MTDAEREAQEIDFSDYHDGSMSPTKRAEFEARLASDAAFRQGYERYVEALRALSGLHKVAPPERLDDKVAETIYRRSAGRFFGPRRLGDRVPFLGIAIVGLVVALVVVVVVRWSLSGLVGGETKPGPGARPDGGAREVMPQP
jgi:anti-sigma factor RsiW